jgi:putative ABC transport system permease protein
MTSLWRDAEGHARHCSSGSLSRLLDDSIGSQTLAARLVFIFAAALLIAMAAVYGVLAYSVTQRRHEMGIRIALGAKRSDVLMLILKNAAFC